MKQAIQSFPKAITQLLLAYGMVPKPERIPGTGSFEIKVRRSWKWDLVIIFLSIAKWLKIIRLIISLWKLMKWHPCITNLIWSNTTNARCGGFIKSINIFITEEIPGRHRLKADRPGIFLCPGLHVFSTLPLFTSVLSAFYRAAWEQHRQCQNKKHLHQPVPVRIDFSDMSPRQACHRLHFLLSRFWCRQCIE